MTVMFSGVFIHNLLSRVICSRVIGSRVIGYFLGFQQAYRQANARRMLGERQLRQALFFVPDMPGIIDRLAGAADDASLRLARCVKATF